MLQTAVPRLPLTIAEYDAIMMDQNIGGNLITVATSLAAHVEAQFLALGCDPQHFPTRPTMLGRHVDDDDASETSGGEIEMQWSYPNARGKRLVMTILDDAILISTPTIRCLELPHPAANDPRNIGDFIFDSLRSI